MKGFKRTLLGSTVLLAAAALAGAAQADVFVTATITKEKEKVVLEDIVKTKLVFIDVFAAPELVGAAESEALANQVTDFNTLDHQNDREDSGDIEIKLRALIEDSVSGSSGVTQLNQDAGNMSNQGNVLAVSVVFGDDKLGDSQASAEQRTNDNEVRATGDSMQASNPQREAEIIGSVNDNSGVTQVNQNDGAMNNQLNAVSAGLADGGVVALSEADLGQYNANNFVQSFVTVKVGRVVDSINGNTGVTNVNQSTGNMNNQGTVMSISGVAELGGVGGSGG